MTSPLSVVLIHRNEQERLQLRSALEALDSVQIAGERSDLRSGIALAYQVRPAILVVELAPPVDDTLQLAAQYKLEHPDVALFLCTDVFDPDMLVRAMRAGANEILRRPLDRGALGQAVDRVAQVATRKQGGGASRRVITVFSNKGGTGVSTIATNLALNLRTHTNKEVALADLDYQSGDVAFLLGIEPKRSMAEVLASPKLDSASVQDALAKHSSGVFVLSQPEQLDRMEAVTPDQVGTLLDILGSTFDITVVDAPHVFNEVTLEIFDRSSTVLLVAEASIPSLRAARRSLEIFQKLNYFVVPDRVRVVINRQSDQNSIDLDQIEETLGVPVFATIANDYGAVSKAINLGRPLCLEAPDSRAGRDLVTLARKISPVEPAVLAPNGAAPETPARGRAKLRLFGRG
ncbi:MAG TPA: P-loop NTPase [Candidatus Eisenbacteria bacterium]|nr:P-loop NTPase [Candidatus Eisenbacteria bacterium]